MNIDRIQELERQVGELQREIATLRGDKPRVMPTPVPRDDQRGVRILRLEEETSFVRPTNKELHSLLAVVLAKFPQLKPQHRDAEEFFDGFEWAFERVGFLRRTDAPDVRHYVGFWASECRDWLASFLSRPSRRCGRRLFARRSRAWRYLFHRR
jgi:hypothetical protein